MNAKSIQKVKRSICKVQGVNRAYNWSEPYLLETEYENGGTAFFIDPLALMGPAFVQTERQKQCRYLLTNFHVVQHYNTSFCILEWPERKNSYITAKIKHVVPNLDVAILEVDPTSPQPKWWQGDAAYWLESIKNCALDTKNIIKGNSQSVKCIGFPNLQSDYQISDGSMSSRGLGMLQLDISFNGGNSGGPLFLKSKVIGICTASVSDCERLGLAVPIQEIYRFFTFWCTYDDMILRLPCWGVQCKHLTSDYLAYKKIDAAYQGALVKRVLDNQAADQAGIRKGDILVGIETRENGVEKKYNIDNFGNVQVPWTDKRVGLESVEFMLNLDPAHVVLHYYRNKKIHQTPIQLEQIEFQVRTRYPFYEHLDYTVFGSMVFSDLHLNHLNDEYEEDEDEEPVAFDHSVLNTLKRTHGMENIVICTRVFPQSYVSHASDIDENVHIVKINNWKVKSCNHLCTLLDRVTKEYYAKKLDYIVIETSEDKHVLSLDKLSEQERTDSRSNPNCIEQLRLLRQRRKRKRR